MRKFQEQMAKDLDDVFFNVPAREFVTKHMIGGTRGGKPSPAVECNVTVDHDLFIERKIKDSVEGVNLDGLVFFIKKSEWIEKFKTIPKVESELRFDGKRHLIDAVRDNMEVLEFTLEAVRG